MNQCLVKQLKATVNNPNLPILETMQQITLDAIALSGNNTMTDEQKYALNHFYHQLGAISNSSLWQKIQGIILPFLANDAAHSVAEYKSNTIYDSQIGSTFRFDSTDKNIKVLPSGGVNYYHNMFEFDFEGDNISVVELFPEAYNSANVFLHATTDSNNVSFGKSSGSTSIIAGIYNGSSYIYRLFTAATASTIGQAFSFGHENALIHGFFMKNDNSLVNYVNLPSYDSGTTYPSKNGSILKLSNDPLRGFVIGKAMTEDELSLVFNSLTTLRTNFIS